MTAKEMEQSARRKIRLLRKNKLKLGLPFMIGFDDLPQGQCYLEFPDGSIKIAEAAPCGNVFKIIGGLDPFNAEIFKRKLKLA